MVALWLAAHPWVVVAALVASCVLCAWAGWVVNGLRSYRAGWRDCDDERQEEAATIAAARARHTARSEPRHWPGCDDPWCPGLELAGKQDGCWPPPAAPPTMVHPTAVLSPLPAPESAAAERLAGPNTLVRGIYAAANDSAQVRWPS